MPQLERTFKKPLDELERKIDMGLISICSLTSRRGRWETTVGNVKCVLLVYEQHAEKVYVKPKEPNEWQKTWDESYTPSWFNPYARDDFQQQPHFGIAINLIDTGEEVRVCGITSGSGQDHYFSPDCGGEFGLFEALDITLNTLDRIIM